MATSISADKIAEAEASFRASLEDVITMAEGLSKHCKTLDDLVGMARLALENEGQLRMLMSTVVGNKN